MPTSGENPGSTLFPDTRWSMVVRAQGDAADPDAHAALSDLCARYWSPLYGFARARNFSPADSEDLVQGFFESLLRNRNLDSVAPEKGRLRSFFAASFKHHIDSDRRHRMAQKRGGKNNPLPMDFSGAEEAYSARAPASDDPEKVFEKRWALTLLDQSLELLEQEYGQKGSPQLFVALHPFLSPEGSAKTLADAASELGISEGNAKVRTFRMRRRFREILREEIAHTVTSPEEIDDELRHLVQIFSTP